MTDSREIIDEDGRYRLVSVGINKNICGGEPCILNTRITVSNLIAALQAGISLQECADNFELSLENCSDALYWIRAKLGDKNLEED